MLSARRKWTGFSPQGHRISKISISRKWDFFVSKANPTCASVSSTSRGMSTRWWPAKYKEPGEGIRLRNWCNDMPISSSILMKSMWAMDSYLPGANSLTYSPRNCIPIRNYIVKKHIFPIWRTRLEKVLVLKVIKRGRSQLFDKMLKDRITSKTKEKAKFSNRSEDRNLKNGPKL